MPELIPPKGIAGLIVKVKRRLKARREAKKKATKKSAKLISGMEQGWKDAIHASGSLLQAFISPDPATRHMAWFMGLCIAGILSVGVYSVRRLALIKDLSKKVTIGSDEQARNLGEFFAKQSNANAARLATVGLGGFVVELKEPVGFKKVPGYMNLAEIDIVAECDNRTTANFISDHMAQARDQLTSVFVATDREQFLNTEGKKRLRRTLVEKLNRWLPKGRVKELYFNKLLIS